MKEIPCEVIRDLFPSYIDELTSETTNQAVKEHLEGCEACREVLSSMKEDTVKEEKPAEEKKQIDFLKKNRQRNRRILFGSIAGALALVLAVLALRLFVIGEEGHNNFSAMNLQVKGKEMQFTAVPLDSASAVSRLSYKEENGVVTIGARLVLVNPFVSGSLSGSYSAGEEIREVRIGNRIIWSEGATVSALASDLFAQRHAYIGDMPANSRLAEALSLSYYLGPFTNELETAEEPYGWRILLSEEIHSENLEQKLRDMNAFGCVIVALIENLDHVTFVFQMDGKEQTCEISASSDEQFFMEDLKSCGKDIRKLDELIQKTGLALYTYPERAERAPEESYTICVQNLSDTELMTFSAAFIKDGELMSSLHGMNADETPMKIGESFWLIDYIRDFGEIGVNSLLEIEFSFDLPYGKGIVKTDRIRIMPYEYLQYDLVFTGNATDGYRIENR